MIKDFIKNQLVAFLGPPRQNYNIFLLNLFGLQVLRYLFAFIKYRLFKFEKLKKNKYLDQLEEDGYTIIKNFLSEKDFQEVLKTSKLIENKKIFKKKKFGNKEVYSYDFFINDNQIESEKTFLINIFNKFDLFPEITKILKVKNSKIQNLSYEKIITGNNFIDSGDVNSEFHSDRFYPCIKMFLYLDDNKKENGSFQYISKSHKFTFHRLCHEYIFSILICYKNFFRKIMPLFGYCLKNNRVTFQIKNIKKKFGNNSIIECNAPRNSLVICNNKGFHKRGTFNAMQTRSHVRLNLYDLQTSRFKRRVFKYLKKKKLEYNV